MQLPKSETGRWSAGLQNLTRPQESAKAVVKVEAKPAKNNMPGLNGLRFFAAFGVMLNHYKEHLRLLHIPFFEEAVVNTANRVGLFFLLSGFLMTVVYGPRFLDGRVTKRTFWLGRFARIYPLYFLFLLITIPNIWMPIAHGDWREFGYQAFMKFFMVQTWVVTPTLPAGEWLGQTWTLSVEAFFYMCFPFLVAPIFRLSPKALNWFLGIVCILSLIPPLAYDIALTRSTPEALGTWYHYISNLPYFRIFGFLLGMAAARIYLLYKESIREVSEETANQIGAGLILGYAGLAALPLHLLKAQGLPQLIFAPLVLLLTQQKGFLSKFMSLPIFQTLGNASFSLFLVHVPFMGIVIGRLRKLGIEDPVTNSPLFGITMVVACVFVSVAVAKFVENPVREFILKKFDKKSPATAAA